MLAVQAFVQKNINLIFDTVDAVAGLANRYCNNKQKNGIKKFKKNTY